ncbi:MAG: alpha/beta hydrolase [Gammaproteobacteria bacterium]|nr:alpha/beta hydrolase [Gammaproteobacteria bacterium]
MLLLLPLVAGCASSGSSQYSIPFMPPPAFLETAEVPPFSDPGPVGVPADPRVLFATLREPAAEGTADRFYGTERAAALRVGSSRIVLGRSDITWDMARKMSILKNSTDEYPLQVAEIEEFGVLDRTLHPLLEPGGGSTPDAAPRERFVAEINSRLATSRDQDIFIYVHGYKVNFENPILVAAELWHFLGYEGVFIPFAWPSRTGRLDYFGDTESARYSALYLREFIELLAEETPARRIHILGYSAGTRLVGAALHQLALVNEHRSLEETRARLRLGNVILVGSDIDRGIFSTYLMDGLLKMQERLTIYESPKDKALGMALLAFGKDRVGQLDPSELTPGAREFLRASDALSLVSIANAPGYDSGNGHSYFRDSPLVSSDLLATLRYGLAPGQRGLAQDPETGVWEFPPDYLERLEGAIFDADPELARRAQEPDATK